MPTRIEKLRALPHKHAWHLAWPMIVSNISVPLMGLADTAMLGHLPNPVYLGAVAIGSNIIALLFWMFGFLRMGTTGATARAVGANQPSLATQHFTQNALLALLLGIGLVALQSLAIPTILWIIAPDDSLQTLAMEYCSIRIYSAPAVLISYVAMGWMIGLGITKYPLAITIAANLLNIGLDYCFIVLWQMDVKGAATATLIAEYFSCFCALATILFILRKKGWRLVRHINFNELKATLKLNADLFLRTMALLLVITFFNAQSALFGNSTLAANAILFQCSLFVAFFLDGYALAAETLSARAIGGRKIAQFHQASAVCGLNSLGIALMLTLLFWGFGEGIIDALTNIKEVASTAKLHLVWLIALPLVSVWAYTLDGIFIGAGHMRTMRNAMMISVLCVFFPAWWLTLSWGNHGLWFAFSIFNLSRGITLTYAYFRRSKHQLWLIPYKN